MGLPLESLRVIDLTQDFAGPFCTMILADLGAEAEEDELVSGTTCGGCRVCAPQAPHDPYDPSKKQEHNHNQSSHSN